MQRALPATALVVLLWAACPTMAQSPGDARLVEAQKAFNEAKRLKEAGEYIQAVTLTNRALELREAVLGSGHPAVASCYELLGELHEEAPLFAALLIQRALAIREAALGKDHPDVAQSLHELASIYHSQGLYASAGPLYERALAIREAALGRYHRDVVQSLNSLAALHKEQGLYALAEPLYKRALAILETTRGEHHPDVATALNNLASIYHSQGLYARAEPLYERALAIREAALGKHHPDVAISLKNLAALHGDQGLYTRAEPLYERVLAIFEAAHGPQHPTVATALDNLAVPIPLKDSIRRAEPLHERALAIREAALGKNHPTSPYRSPASPPCTGTKGSTRGAEPLLERALEIYEAARGKNHPVVATILNNQGTSTVTRGSTRARSRCMSARWRFARPPLARITPTSPDRSSASLPCTRTKGSTRAPSHCWSARWPYLKRLLARITPTLPPSSTTSPLSTVPRNSTSVRNRCTSARWSFARPSWARTTPASPNSLTNLAALYVSRGLYTRAEPLMERALAIFEAAHGKQHPDVATVLNNLAVLYDSRGLYVRAERLHERALEIREAALGKYHPDVALSLNNLAVLHVAQKRLAKALPLVERAFAITEAHLRQEVYGFSETRLPGFLNLLRVDEDRLYRLARSIRKMRLCAVSPLLRRSFARAAPSRKSPTPLVSSTTAWDRRSVPRSTACVRCAPKSPPCRSPALESSLSRPTNSVSRNWRTRPTISKKSLQGARLRRALRALPPPSELMDRVAAALPKDGALIELIAYNDIPRVPKPGPKGSRAPSQLRYLALLLFADGRTHAVDLGPAAPIDAAVLRLHEVLDSKAASYLPAAQALYQLAIRPLVPQLGKVRRLFLSPDSQLSLVPFASLHDGRRFLVDDWDISYLTSGKELLLRPEDISSVRSVVVIADPDFGSASAAPLMPLRTAPVPEERATPRERFFSSLRAELRDRPGPPLPGTRREAEAIQRLFPEAQLLLGSAATKDALLNLPTPGILHIATHGIFLEDEASPPVTRAVGTIGAIVDAGPLHRPPDPLLRSGLMLASARATGLQPGSRYREDSFVTALELAGMDLWGTQLVVLSACDTGRGDVKLGQGVYGLRRALVAAGAETLVTSLWKVDDGTTQELMEAYYRALLKGRGRTTALREAMLELRKKKPHPHFWAPFISSGRDTPLRMLELPPPAPAP